MKKQSVGLLKIFDKKRQFPHRSPGVPLFMCDLPRVNLHRRQFVCAVEIIIGFRTKLSGNGFVPFIL